MKKIFTLLCAAAALSMTAQAEKTACLRQIKADYAFETTDYYYFPNGLVEQIQVKNLDNIKNSYYGMFEYDEMGNLTKMSEFQDALEEMELDKYLPVNYVEYKYNTLGQRVERRNYNNWGALQHPDEPNFQLGAVMMYEYDMDGKLSEVRTYWDLNLTKLHQVDKYIYNDKGLLVKREISQNSFDNELLHNGDVNYIYNEADMLIETQQCDFDPATGVQEVKYCMLYNYDAEGNLTSEEKTSATKLTVVNKFVYFYTNKVTNFEPDKDDEYTLADIAYPIDPESDRTLNLYSNLRNIIDYYEEWDTDQVSGNLMKFDTFFMGYGEIVQSGIKQIDAARPQAAGLTFAGVSGNKLMLHGINAMDNVRVYDMEGRQVINDAYRASGLDVTNLPAGAYIVSTANGSAKFVK